MAELKVPKESVSEEDQEPDPLSTAESKTFLSEGDLEKAADNAQHNRRENIRNLLAFWLKWLLRVLSCIAIIFILIWAWHLLAPPKIRWLSTDEIELIKSVFSTAALGAIVGFLIQSRYL